MNPDLIFSGCYGDLIYLVEAKMADARTRIGIVNDHEAHAELARVYQEWRVGSGQQQVPGILKCFCHRPDFLQNVITMGDCVHFSDGHLNRRIKEAIASWVSYLNRCPY